MRDAFSITAYAFYEGDIPWQARSRDMRHWVGHANRTQRLKFNSIVAERMQELGWQVDQEVKLTKLVTGKLDRDYGDVDVVAWRGKSGRVLVIECKDLQHRKTFGEVAEQLADFRGELNSAGKPDHLKRHLDRIAVLKKHQDAVSRTLKLSAPIQVEGHLVFKNHVPMQFAWDHMASRIRLSIFDELHQL